MATSTKRDMESPKGQLPKNTPPIVSQQEWGCAPAAPSEGEGLDPLP
jgi:hypothetical protein